MKLDNLSKQCNFILRRVPEDLQNMYLPEIIEEQEAEQNKLNNIGRTRKSTDEEIIATASQR